MKTSKIVLAGGALAGGAASVVVAEKFGLTPIAAGGATAGVALAGSTLVKNETVKDALYAASLGAGGLVGVQLFGQWVGHRQATAAKPAGNPKQRMADADGGYVTRQELNDALSQVADKNAHALGQFADKNAEQHKQTTCDLTTAMRDEIRRAIAEVQQPAQQTGGGMPHLYPLYPARAASGEDERNALADDEYMRNAYSVDDERNAAEDEYSRNAYGDDERNAGDDEYSRNAYGDDERNAFADDERNASADDDDMSDDVAYQSMVAHRAM